MPIAVVPFGWESTGAAPFDVAEVVAADLQRSGRFAPLDRKDMIDRPTAGEQIRFQDWRYLKSDFIAVGKLDARRRRPLRGAVRAVQRAHRPAPGRAAADCERGFACARCRTGSPTSFSSSSPGIRGAFSTRVAFVSVEGTPPQQRYKLIVADCRRREPADHRQLDRAADVAGLVAGRPEPRVCLVREQSVGDLRADACARGERRRVSARAGINGAPAWSPDGKTLALTLSRKDGDVDVYTLKLSTPGADAHDVRSGHRHRAGLVAGRPQAVLQVGSRRRSADL